MANIDFKKLYDTDPVKAQTLADLLGLDLQAELDKETKKRKARKLPKVLKPEQVERLLGAINLNTIIGTRQLAIVGAMLKAGLRESEVSNMMVADVDLIKGDLFVQEGKNNSDRHVPIGPELMSWLKDWDAIRPESEYFFCTLKGTQVHPRCLYDLVTKLSKRAKVWVQDGRERKYCYPHMLRHTYATGLLRNGLNIRQIQQLLGHKSVTTTQIYTEVDMVELDKKIKDLG